MLSLSCKLFTDDNVLLAAILDFSTPERLRVHLSSLSTPHFATSYTLGTVGVIDGSVSYLFSTVPLNGTPSRTALIPLRKLAPGYRQIQAPVDPLHDPLLDANARYYNYTDRKPTLLHAALHLPPPTTLNALLLRRMSPTMQWSLAACSTRGPPLSKSAPQAAILTQISHDTGKYSNEYLFSTDNALFGWRGLWNFGPDPRKKEDLVDGKPPSLPSLLSAGAEAYYSPLSSLVGMSTGLRFTTLPPATEAPPLSSPLSNTGSPVSTFPYSLTLTLTPLTGSLSATYSVRASPNIAFSSRFGFNVYGWESEMVAGCELWRQTRKRTAEASDDDDDGLEWARRKMRMNVLPPTVAAATETKTNTAVPRSSSSGEEEVTESVVKVRVDQSWNVRLLWEGRVKELLVRAGGGLGPSSFSPGWSSGGSSPNASGQSAGGGLPGAASYWRGVGVSVLYSS